MTDDKTTLLKYGNDPKNVKKHRLLYRARKNQCPEEFCNCANLNYTKIKILWL